ncbi:hypothetical protein Tco_0877378 [Tanacetum coccineum]|uniref:Uncharacterized protein n=1 Tax=Tanacetum coccineum TaxID=301880 RepID=A0ABQ5BXZ0_9ASTR
MDEEATNVEDEGNELYRDVNINLKGRDVEMTDASLPNVQATQETEDTHVILTALINPEGIDLIFGLNTEATLLVDVPVTIIAEPSSLATTTIPLPPTPLFTHLLQTPATVPSSSLQDLPNFGFLFRFDHRLKALEDNFYEFKQTNQFAEAVSSILGIVDQYLVNKINDAVKTVVQLQSDRLREEAQAENQEFINTMDVGMKKIIKEQVKEQVKDQVSKILPRIKKLVNDNYKLKALLRNLYILVARRQQPTILCFTSLQRESDRDVTQPQDKLLVTKLENIALAITTSILTGSFDKSHVQEACFHVIFENVNKKCRCHPRRVVDLQLADGTLSMMFRSALIDHLKGIQMEYLPQTIWRQRDKDNTGAMIQEIDKQLKTRRIMRSLEKFVGGRPYEGDLRLLQMTI